MAASAIASVQEWRAGSNLASPLGSLESMSTIARFAARRSDLSQRRARGLLVPNPIRCLSQVRIRARRQPANRGFFGPRRSIWLRCAGRSFILLGGDSLWHHGRALSPAQRGASRRFRSAGGKADTRTGICVRHQGREALVNHRARYGVRKGLQLPLRNGRSLPYKAGRSGDPSHVPL